MRGEPPMARRAESALPGREHMDAALHGRDEFKMSAPRLAERPRAGIRDGDPAWLGRGDAALAADAARTAEPTGRFRGDANAMLVGN